MKTINWDDKTACEFVGFYGAKTKQGIHDMQAILDAFKAHVIKRDMCKDRKDLIETMHNIFKPVNIGTLKLTPEMEAQAINELEEEKMKIDFLTHH